MKYSKKEIYRLLGAEKFQKVVFFLEKGKYKILDHFFPNIRDWYEDQLNKKFQKKLEKENIEDKDALLAEYQNQKLAFRRELVYKQNRNYHYNTNYPTKFIKYLEWNKKVHINGIKKDICMLVGVPVLSVLLGNPSPTISTILMLASVSSLAINFECVNLQNYNLYRFQNEKTYQILEKVEERRRNTNLEKLGSSIVPVAKAVTEDIALPTIDQVVSKITTVEQATRLKEYVQQQYKYLEQQQTKEYVKEKRRI